MPRSTLMLSDDEWNDLVALMLTGETNDFAHLVSLAGLDATRHLRFANWSNISFRGSDIRGFNFAGARLCNCDFTDAYILGARFDLAVLNGSDLSLARDWLEYVGSWAACKESSDQSLPTGGVFQDAPFAPRLVVIPRGKFTMGSPLQEKGRSPSEGPPHEVEILHRLAVGCYPLTYDEWDYAAKNGMLEGVKRMSGSLSVFEPFPEDHGWGRGKHPVTGVTYEDAQSYVGWLSHRTNKNYRLLSEAEWEYCCRAGTLTAYSFGDNENLLVDHAWFKENAGNVVHPVGEKTPNKWGLYDTHGNVWEFVQDSWHDDYSEKPRSLGISGGVWANLASKKVVIRGGAMNFDASNLRSASRNWGDYGSRGQNAGFRVARELDDES